MATNPYLTFASESEFSMCFDYEKPGDGTLEWSTDARTWGEWEDGTTELTSAEHDGEQRVYLRGTGITTFDASYLTLNGENIRCEGNIETLLDYSTVTVGEHPPMGEACFVSLFQDCTSLTQAPELPATTLTMGCYISMFCGCTSLTQAPELPATTLAESCYYNMFCGCTSLTQAPELPATTLAESCYYNMFCGCTGIKLSTTQDDEYQTAYCIPPTGDGTTASGALTNMFTGTGGTFKGRPTINTVYYMAVPVEEATTVDYTLTYETAHGTAPDSKVITVNEGESYTLTEDDLPALEAEGYTFNGWLLNGSTASVGDTISADTTLTAVWTEDIVSTFNKAWDMLGYVIGMKLRDTEPIPVYE